MLNKESSKLKIKLENGFKENVKSITMAITNFGSNDSDILKKLESNKLENKEKREGINTAFYYLFYSFI